MLYTLCIRPPHMKVLWARNVDATHVLDLVHDAEYSSLKIRGDPWPTIIYVIEFSCHYTNSTRKLLKQRNMLYTLSYTYA